MPCLCITYQKVFIQESVLCTVEDILAIDAEVVKLGAVGQDVGQMDVMIRQRATSLV